MIMLAVGVAVGIIVTLSWVKIQAWAKKEEAAVVSKFSPPKT